MITTPLPSHNVLVDAYRVIAEKPLGSEVDLEAKLLELTSHSPLFELPNMPFATDEGVVRTFLATSAFSG